MQATTASSGATSGPTGATANQPRASAAPPWPRGPSRITRCPSPRQGRRYLSERIDKVYEGSAMSLVLQALAGGRASQAEIDEARRLLDELEKNA